MRVGYLLLALNCIAFPAFSQDVLPSGWKLADKSQGYVVEGDLNGDGVRDKAVLVTNGAQTKLLGGVPGTGSSGDTILN